MKNQNTPIIAIIMALLFFAFLFVYSYEINKRDEIIDQQYEVIEIQTKAIETQKAVIRLYKELTKTQKLIIEKQEKKEAKLIVNNSRQEKIYNYIL